MTLQAMLVIALMIFTIGLAGVVARTKFSIALISLWLMFNSAAIAAVAFARWNLLPDGKVIGMLIAVAGVIVVASGYAYFIIEERSSRENEKSSGEQEI